ncbi:hypothetical protein IE81DRAFT_346805 [Ceraceosorus guamensis]|uniref:Uncharacterized protein n=1 Tax=Ceraceosorus guamensis TaxID=1522189 RepID=A0A316W0A3_9BASI|nr:hypothetical protein IE81DRAFT_346805 [Ceraceosorus guamensis]PWN43210.1 hypothetical protein IE81DRAFT_346805 [Ceraceosorus guamensis]
MARKHHKLESANDGSSTKQHHRGAHKAYQNLLGLAQAKACADAKQTLDHELEVGRAELNLKLKGESETVRAELNLKLKGESETVRAELKHKLEGEMETARAEEERKLEREMETVRAEKERKLEREMETVRAEQNRKLEEEFQMGRAQNKARLDKQLESSSAAQALRITTAQREAERRMDHELMVGRASIQERLKVEAQQALDQEFQRRLPEVEESLFQTLGDLVRKFRSAQTELDGIKTQIEQSMEGASRVIIDTDMAPATADREDNAHREDNADAQSEVSEPPPQEAAELGSVCSDGGIKSPAFFPPTPPGFWENIEKLTKEAKTSKLFHEPFRGDLRAGEQLPSSSKINLDEVDRALESIRDEQLKDASKKTS